MNIKITKSETVVEETEITAKVVDTEEFERKAKLVKNASWRAVFVEIVQCVIWVLLFVAFMVSISTSVIDGYNNRNALTNISMTVAIGAVLFVIAITLGMMFSSSCAQARLKANDFMKVLELNKIVTEANYSSLEIDRSEISQRVTASIMYENTADIKEIKLYNGFFITADCIDFEAVLNKADEIIEECNNVRLFEMHKKRIEKQS